MDIEVARVADAVAERLRRARRDVARRAELEAVPLA
jgi:hypothetical protein